MQLLLILVTSVLGGDLNITATTLDITDSGSVDVTGDSTFTAATGRDITLDNSASTFDGTLSFVASSGVLNDVTIVNDTALDLQLLSIGGNLNATGAGIAQSGTLTIVGTTSLTSTGAGNDILLAGTNDFGTSLSLTTDVAAGSDATLIDTTSVSLAASSIGGLLDLTAPGIDIAGAVSAASLDLDASGGALTDTTGSLSVAGNAALTVTGVSALTLDNAANEFSTVELSSGTGAVTLVDATAVSLGASTVGGLLDLTATGIDITGAVSAASLDLDASGGALTDTGGSLSVAGSAALTVTGTSVLTLDNVANEFATILLNSGSGTATIVDATAINLGTSTVGGLLDLTAVGIDITGAVSAASLDLDASGGALTDTGGSLSVAGNAALTVTGSSVLTLDNAANEFATVLVN